MKIGIGTVQFGMNYGVSNDAGIVTLGSAHDILDLGQIKNIKTLDTAYSYGDSERVLGKYKDLKEFEVITKLPHGIHSKREDELLAFFNESLERLHLENIYGLMTHTEEDFLGSDVTINTLNKLKEQKRVEKIGASFYNADVFIEACRRYEFDIAQVPLSIFDQEFLTSGAIELARKKGIELHVRSIYLQGLIFVPIEKLNDFFQPVRGKIEAFHKLRKKHNMTEVECATSFIEKVDGISKVIIGFQNIDQFKGLLDLDGNVNVGLEQFKDLDFFEKKYSKPINWRLE